MLGRTTAVTVLTAGAMAPFSGSAFAADQYDCGDFSTQQEAQNVFEQDTSDPSGLDRDDDRVACESLASGSGAGAGDEDGSDSTDQVSRVPRGAADTGGGSTATGGDTELLAGGAALLAALGLGGYSVAQRARPRHRA